MTISVNEAALLSQVEAVVKDAGRQMRERFSRTTRPRSRQAIDDLIGANDAVSLATLRRGLTRLRPAAGWVEDELDEGPLPDGEWWIVDPVEGAINHIHGMTDWCVTATLMRDNRPVVTVVHVPLTGETYSAVRGGGATLDGVALSASAKTDFKAALVGTGQARPGEDHATHRKIGQSVTAMLDAALVVRVSVPATWQLIDLAAGRTDAFWQFSAVRSGLVAGALLVEEAGGLITDLRGGPWTLASDGFLAAARGVHAQAVQALALAACSTRSDGRMR